MRPCALHSNTEEGEGARSTTSACNRSARMHVRRRSVREKDISSVKEMTSWLQVVEVVGAVNQYTVSFLVNVNVVASDFISFELESIKSLDIFPCHKYLFNSNRLLSLIVDDNI